MRKIISLVPIMLFICGCGQEEAGGVSIPGYWFHILLVVIPLLVLLVKLFMDMREIKDSLLSIEGQERRLLSRMDALEEKLMEKIGEQKSRSRSKSKKEG